MPSDPFASPKLKLTRAKKNRDDFASERVRFINEYPWSQVTDTGPDGFSKQFKVRLTKPFPDTLSELISYATNNLRSCLDGATWATAVCSGKNGKNAPFPFGDSPDGLEQCIKGRCKDIPSDILTVVRKFRPYKTGNALLWAINHIANMDKHALVIPMAAGLSSLVFTGIMPKGSTAITFSRAPIFSPSHPIWRPEDNEIIYSVTGTNVDSEVRANYDVHIMLDVAFGKIEIVAGKRAISVLNDMISEVESVLLAIEGETRRLFPDALPLI